MGVPPADGPAVIDEIRAALPGDYTVDGYLDGGGQGAIYRGTYQGHVIALKIFRPGTDQRRLARELKALATINSPYLVAVRDYRDISIGGDQLSAVAYEFLPGGDLRQHLAAGAPEVDEQTLVRIGKQISIAMAALWKERIVHRDIKPANIVKATDIRYVLVDLGLARHVDRSALTSPGALPGTMGYQSPEQANGRRNLTIHSDVFSLGLTVYEVAAKRHPFGRAQHMIGATQPLPLKSLRPDLSDGFTRLIHQMMAITPSHRPYNAHDRFSQLEVA